MFFHALAVWVVGVLFSLFISVPPQQEHFQSESDVEVQIRKYDDLVKQYRYSNPDSAVYFVNLGLELARRYKHLDGEAMMLNESGMIDDNAGKFIDSRAKYLEAQSIYRSTGNHKGEAAVTVRLGVVELRKGNYDKAIGYFLESLKISERHGNSFGIMEANLTLAEGYMGQEKYDTALKYLKRAEMLDETLPFSSLSLNIVNNFGVIYRETGNFEQSIQYLKKGISKSDVPQFHGLYITLTNNLATVYAKQGLEQKSIELQKEALNKARTIKNYLRELQCLKGLATSYERQNPAEALSYLQEALTLATAKKARKQEIDILGDMADIYRQTGNLSAAYDAKAKQHHLADSFYYHAMSAQIMNMQSAYELDKSKARVQQLEFINTEHNLERKIILSITFGSVLIVVILAIFYFRTRELNARLNKMNTELHDSNSVKDKLFSILAHDLRSPFATTLSILQFLRGNYFSEEERQEIISELEDNCKVSLETLDALLKWGQMQIKGIHLNQKNFDPMNIINRTISLFAKVAEEKSISIQNHINRVNHVYADPDHFEFVFRNLLSNAIKFTPEHGTVIIKSAETNGMVQFSIRDNGVGIEPNRLDRIFTLNNVSTNGTNEEKGTSLGLVISKEFINANGGDIAVESKAGEGSEFIVSLQKVRS